MVNEKIDLALELLQQIGIQTVRGYPGTKIPMIYNPVVTVCLESWTEDSLTLAADVFVPAQMDGSECEETAIRVASILGESMARCSVGSIHYSAPSGLFNVRVLAKWYRELDYAVKIGDEAVAHTVGFASEKTLVRLPYVDSATGESLVTVAGLEWKITVKDVVPLQQKLVAEKTGSFSMTVIRPGGLEVYEECIWEQITLEETPAGVLRTRVAVTNQERVIGAG